MMFSRVVAVSALALPLLAAATPVELVARQSCSTGSVQCCNSTVAVSEPVGDVNGTICSPSVRSSQANSASGNLLLGLLGIVLGDITGLIGHIAVAMLVLIVLPTLIFEYVENRRESREARA